jgi:hypothetical protein
MDSLRLFYRIPKQYVEAEHAVGHILKKDMFNSNMQKKNEKRYLFKHIITFFWT